MASQAERDIRDAVAEHIRGTMPAARIIHELVVGGCRADLAAVEPERVTLFEIKSSRDTLSRLDRQVRSFRAAAHRVVVVADERWFEAFEYRSGAPGFRATEALKEGCSTAELWCFPQGRIGAEMYRWAFPYWRDNRPEPHAAKLLGLLWKAELLTEANRHRVAAGSRRTCPALIRDMAWLMTGKEIAQAVCRQLRQRHFPEADAPIFGLASAA